MRKAAYGLFALGVMIAICGGAKLPAAGQRFPDTVPAFLVGSVLAAAGVLWWRLDLGRRRRPGRAWLDRQRPGSDRAGAGAAAADPLVLIGQMLNAARQFQARLPELDGTDLAAGVDRLLEQFMLPFVESRAGLIERLGMSAGAELLVTVAFAERMLNRAWSAACDGHLPEARSSYAEAVQALEEAASGPEHHSPAGVGP